MRLVARCAHVADVCVVQLCALAELCLKYPSFEQSDRVEISAATLATPPQLTITRSCLTAQDSLNPKLTLIVGHGGALTLDRCNI